MKLYISYYGNYVSIVEGSYNSKKEKYNIKKYMVLSSEEVPLDENDKYSLLREALKLDRWKAKNAVLCLNTRDVLIKSNNISKVSPKDLDGIMSHEIYEMMSLNDDQYTFSYEVVKERNDEGKESLDVIIAAVMNEELYTILDIFKEFKLNLEGIDTMATAYSRLLKNIEYDNIMMLNIGEYGSIVNIYKEDSLFIYDNVPVRINKRSSDVLCLALVDEIKGLMNFYSSRNYGNSIDTVVIVGQSSENTDIVDSFKYSFNSEIVSGIENLFDITEDIQGDIQINEISKVCDILGSMCVVKDKKSYSYMNLLPLKQRNKQKKTDIVRKYFLAAPIALGIIAAPYFVFGAMNMKVLHDTNLAQVKLDKIMNEYKGIESINQKIKTAEEELEIYNMLSSKDVKWGNVLNEIDKNIPYKVDLTNISVTYENPALEQTNSEEIENDVNMESTAETEVPIYDKIPNTINIEGIAKDSVYVGQFVYSLNKLTYFKSAKLISSTEDKENGGQVFNIVLDLKEGVVSGD